MKAGREHRRRVRTLAVVSVAVALLGAAGTIAATSTVVVSDATEDVDGALDLQRAALSLPSDGRLRLAATFAAKVETKDLQSRSGPPGSLCMKVWTTADADPTAMRADRLVCVTATKDDDLRATVYGQAEPGLPKRLGAATASLSDNRRSIVLRVSQSALGRPELIRYAVESTRPGCERVSCIDQVPDKGAVRRFRIHG